MKIKMKTVLESVNPKGESVTWKFRHFDSDHAHHATNVASMGGHKIAGHDITGVVFRTKDPKGLRRHIKEYSRHYEVPGGIQSGYVVGGPYGKGDKVNTD